jgi:hypothetical protein
LNHFKVKFYLNNSIYLKSKYLPLWILLFCALLFSSTIGTAQTPVDTTAKVHSVKKATLLSTFLPGAGQVYNKKAWKVPIIYAGFAGMAYLIKFNNDNYHKYNDALIARNDGDSTTVDNEFQDKYTDENLATLQDYYRSNRDLSIIVTSLIYVLNIIDAHVDAHLYTFNVNDNLSIKVEPEFQFNQIGTKISPTSLLAFKMRF